MPCNQEENSRWSQGYEHGVGQSPGHAQVNQEVYNSKEVTEQAVQQRQSLNGMKVLAAEQFHSSSKHEARCRQGDHAEESESQEESPGIVI